ncbi:MAG TPA: hypothetical protein VF075_04225 [Pyrinomonadaceae bacterium]
MKLPFEFGIKLIFRLVLPGFLLTLGLYPPLMTLRDRAGWTIDVEYLLVFSMIITGWLLLTLDQPIYMFLEGRRFWLRPIRTIFIWTEDRRLKKLKVAEDKFYELSQASTGGKKQNYNQRYVEASVEKRKFPLDANGLPEARFPTRLGNLIDSYESYPSKRYGVNAIFHWYRIWLTLDKDLREELDNRQALADSSVYASIALLISGLLWLVYWLLSKMGSQLIGHFSQGYSLWLGAAFLVVSYIMYRAALHPQAQYGESFKSVFDLNEKQINVTRIVEQVADLTHNPELVNQTRQQQLQTAWRYLHNYKVKCLEPGCEFRYPMPPEEFKAHYDAMHAVPAGGAQGAPDFQPYRENLKRAYTHEKVISSLKVLSVVLGLLLVAAGIYRNTSLYMVLAIFLNVICLGLEVSIRQRQKNYTEATFQFENTFEFPHIYTNPQSDLAKAAQLWLPYIVVLLLAIVLLILGYSSVRA